MTPAAPGNAGNRRRDSARALSCRAAIQLMGAAARCAAPAAGGGGVRPFSGSSLGKVELVYQDWRPEWFPQMVQEMLDGFHATYPPLGVFFVPDPENAVSAERMLSDFQSGTAPDAFQGCFTHFPVWAQRGYPGLTASARRANSTHLYPHPTPSKHGPRHRSAVAKPRQGVRISSKETYPQRRPRPSSSFAGMVTGGT